ncbi:hypothetical protein MRX96_035577 [Rhipicephalus microplus]
MKPRRFEGTCVNSCSGHPKRTVSSWYRLPEPPFARSKGVPDSILFRMRDVRNLTDFVSQFLEGYRTYQETIQDPPPPVAPLHIAYLYEGHGNLTSFPYCLSLSSTATTTSSSSHPSSEPEKRDPWEVPQPRCPTPEPGTCLPSKQLVEFPKPTDPSIILWPPCTRVPRCGGCCPSTILKCAPTKTSNVTFKVIKAQYPEPGASKFNFVGHEIVTLEKHDKCSCECKERPADCNALQQYSDAETTPSAPRGFYYNTRTCRCEQLGRSRIASRIRQPLPRLYAPYTDNRENLQSRSYRNLDLIVGDDYSRPYTDSEHAPTVRRDLSTKTTSRTSSAVEASPSKTTPPDAAAFDGVTSAVPRAETE